MGLLQAQSLMLKPAFTVFAVAKTRDSRRRLRSASTQLLCAILCGLLLHFAASYAPAWPLMFLALILLTLQCLTAKPAQLLALGYLTAATFWLSHLTWLTTYLGATPYLALALFLSCYFALAQFLAAFFMQRITRRHGKTKPALSAFTAASVFAACWLGRETLEGAWPWGGFAWWRLAATQLDGPLAHLLPYTGAAGFTGLLVTGTVFATVWCYQSGFRLRRLTAIALIPAVLLLMPQQEFISQGTLKIAAVQGNAKAGIFQNRNSGQVFSDHYTTTAQYLQKTAAKPDLLLWPENSAEFNLPKNPGRLSMLRSFTAKTGGVLLVGTVRQDAATSRYYNSAVLIGHKPQMPRYDKQHPVPFGEFLPARDFFMWLVPDLASLITLDYTPGNTRETLKVKNTKIGVGICFDNIFDTHTSKMLDANAQLLVSLTNNADFGHSVQSIQQLRLLRLQAATAGRATVSISTVGVSAVIDPHGKIIKQLPMQQAGVLTHKVPKITAQTLAASYGTLFALLPLIFAIFGYGYCAFATRRAR